MYNFLPKNILDEMASDDIIRLKVLVNNIDIPLGYLSTDLRNTYV